MSHTRERRTRRSSSAVRPSTRSPEEPGAPPAWSAARTTALVAAFAVTFSLLAVGSYTRLSATWDEPIHLTSGYAAAAHQDHRVDPSHPPLVRMWAAIPALFMRGVSLMPIPDGRFTPGWLSGAYQYAHRFAYQDNDGDRLLYAGRFMIVLLGIGLGVLVFLWTREWLGAGAAALALVLYTLEPNLLAHASLVTTDFGVTCFVFGAMYFLWRTCRAVTPANVAGLSLFVAAAVTSKFSALLLGPIVVLLLAVATASRTGITRRQACTVIVVMAMTSYAAIWASYGFRYLPGPSSEWLFALHDTSVIRNVGPLGAIAGWIDGHRLLPNAFTQGLLLNASSAQQLPGYLMGDISADGWWYYFPVAFGLKTPLVLLGLAGAGLIACLRRPAPAGMPLAFFLLLPIAAFLGVAMWGGVNVGLRHILPIFPFVVMLGAAGAARLLSLRPRVAVPAAALLAVALIGEAATAYPYPLTFFNQLAGGPRNGYRYLDDSNLSWGQSLKPLKTWMDEQGVSHVNLAYFGQADPSYYGIDSTHLPGAPTFASDSVARPRLPGYVAISSVHVNGVYSSPWWQLFYEPFRDLEPAAVIGNSIRVYWVDEWPHVESTDADAHRMLADALLFGLEWPSQAAHHYRRYAALRPNDPRAREYLQRIAAGPYAWRQP